MMKALAGGVIIGLLMCAGSVSAGPGGRDPDREVLVLIRPELPGSPGVKRAWSPSASFRSEAARRALALPEVKSIERACPQVERGRNRKVLPDGRIAWAFDLADLYRVQVSSSRARSSLIAALRRAPEVILAEPNQPIYLRAQPNDPSFPKQWNLQNLGQAGGTPGADVGAPKAWDFVTASPLIRIGIVDLGVDASHPELGGRVTGQVGNDAHATGVAGVAAASGNNAAGLAGIAWTSPIISKIVDQSDAASVALAIRDAVDDGCQIINMSWGMIQHSDILEDAIAYGHQHNVLMVVAMPSDTRPGDYPRKLTRQVDHSNVYSRAGRASAET